MSELPFGSHYSDLQSENQVVNGIAESENCCIFSIRGHTRAVFDGLRALRMLFRPGRRAKAIDGGVVVDMIALKTRVVVYQAGAWND
jgi:hypothetical protein